MQQITRDQVFISYSQKDRQWLKKLQTMLKPLVSKNLVVVRAEIPTEKSNEGGEEDDPDS
jgi:hypothetical protein